MAVVTPEGQKLLMIMNESHLKAPRELLYFTDPMCSWCYGFGPEVRNLKEAHGDVPFTVVQGGLRPYERNPTPKATAKEILGHWEHVAEASGLPFARSFFDDHPGFIYDTAPACKAVVVAGKLDSERMLAYQEELQKRFYAQAEDPTSVETFVAAAASVGLDAESFRLMFDEPDSEHAVRQHFAVSRELGVAAFPTLALRIGEQYYLLARGFARAGDLEQRFEAVEREHESRRAGTAESP